jgi:hypothetical protein
MNKTTIILNLIKPQGEILILFLIVFGVFNVQTFSAQEIPSPKVKVIVAPTPKALKPKQTNEKFIAVEPKVNISIPCVEGNIKINGWERSEVRVYIKDGSPIGFKVAEKHPRTEKPVWVFVLGVNPQENKEGTRSDCLSGSAIELDVPRDAILNLNGKNSRISVESVRKVRIENLSGSILLNDISEGIEAKTYGGGILVENSSGAMALTSSSGNIVAIDVRQSEFGDYFKAKTGSGVITLQSVEHRQIETGTISGAINFIGNLINGGQYGFGTQNGAITLILPTSVECKLNAWYGFGGFDSEIPLQNARKVEQNLTGQFGQKETTCAVNFKTYSGAIRIKKQE